MNLSWLFNESDCSVQTQPWLHLSVKSGGWLTDSPLHRQLGRCLAELGRTKRLQTEGLYRGENKSLEGTHHDCWGTWGWVKQWRRPSPLQAVYKIETSSPWWGVENSSFHPKIDMGPCFGVRKYQGWAWTTMVHPAWLTCLQLMLTWKLLDKKMEQRNFGKAKAVCLSWLSTFTSGCKWSITDICVSNTWFPWDLSSVTFIS